MEQKTPVPNRQNKQFAGGNGKSSSPSLGGLYSAGLSPSRPENTPPASNQNFSAAEDRKFKAGVPPPPGAKEDFQSRKTADISPKNYASAPPADRNESLKNFNEKISPPAALSEAVPLAAAAENGGNKSFKMIMAATIVFLTIILLAAIFIFKKDALVAQPEVRPSAPPAATADADSNPDSDNDGLPDLVEQKLGTLANNTDTDGDGYGDMEEVKNGYSPFIAGAEGKYTPEQWQAVKDKIISEDENLFNILFSTTNE